jgi:hypothetical protein
MKTAEEFIKQNPWMEAFKNDLRDHCHDCGAKLGRKHKRGCDTARCLVCGGQRLQCNCKGGHGDIWTGLMYPKYHQIAFENDLWCHTLVRKHGELEWHPVPMDDKEDEWNKLYFHYMYNFINGYTRMHVPCKKGDIGAYADLNRAAVFMSGK